MREIKFRAWDGKKMIYNDGDGWFRLYSDGTWELSNESDFATCEDEWLVNPAKSGRGILMQFVGLKDKNGREIYEGDIINPVSGLESFGPGAIVYLAPSYAWKPNGTRYGFSLSSFDWRLPEEIYEVIGNIYENPDLLKGE